MHADESGAAGSREVSPPQPQTWSPQARPRGGHICHPVGRVPDQPGSDRRHLPPGILTQKVAQTPVMQAQMGTRSHEEHLGFLERSPKMEEK